MSLQATFTQLSLWVWPGPESPRKHASLAHLLQLTSKTDWPSWLVSKALKRKVAYVLRVCRISVGEQAWLPDRADFLPHTLWGSANPIHLAFPTPPEPLPKDLSLTSLEKELGVNLLEKFFLIGLIPLGHSCG